MSLWKRLFGQPKSGLEAIPGWCSKLHQPPQGTEIPLGMHYRHVCPECGESFYFESSLHRRHYMDVTSEHFFS
jgi:hypothetical protein